MESFIKPDQTWVLWTFIAGWAAISIYLESKYEWGRRVTSSIIALTGALILSNLNIIPTSSPVYDTVWGYVIPLSIPMLLFDADIKKIWKESGRLLILFVIGSAGTFVGALIGFKLLHSLIPNLGYAATIMTGSYIGGGVNFVALADAFNAPGEIVATTTVADNLLMAIYFFVLLSIPKLGFIKKHFSYSYEEDINVNMKEIENIEEKEEETKNPIRVIDLAFIFGIAVFIVTVSIEASGFFARVIPTSNHFMAILNSLFGNMYLVLTTLTMILATIFSEFFKKINGAQEMGIYLMALFMVVIGAPASIKEIILKAPLLLVFCAIIILFNLLFTLIGTKVFKFSIEEAIIASNSNIGGPATSSAMAIAKGWNGLIGPAVLVGVCGYIIGNYLGIIMGNMIL